MRTRPEASSTQLLIVTLALSCAAATARAEWPRTLNVEDTRTAGRGALQAEVAATVVEWPSYAAGKTYAAVPLARCGVSPSWDVEFEGEFRQNNPEHGGSESGIGDSIARTRYRFMDEASGLLDMAAILEVRIPTGDEDKGLGTGGCEPEGRVAVARTVGLVALVGNASYRAIPEAREREEDSLFYWGLEAACPLGKRFGLNAWLDGQTGRWIAQDDDMWAGGGLRFCPTPRIRLGARVEFGLTDDTPDWDAGLRAGYEF